MENLLEVVDGTWKNIIKDLLYVRWKSRIWRDFSYRDTNIWESITVSYLPTLIVPNDGACKQNMKQNISVKAFNQGLIF